jgi:hypothetical protein
VCRSRTWVSQYLLTQRRVSELPTYSEGGYPNTYLHKGGYPNCLPAQRPCIYLLKNGQRTYAKGVSRYLLEGGQYLSNVGILIPTCGNLRLKVKSPCQTVIPKIIRGNRRLKIRSPVSDSDSHVLLIFRRGFPRIVVSINVRLSEVRIHEKRL